MPAESIVIPSDKGGGGKPATPPAGTAASGDGNSVTVHKTEGAAGGEKGLILGKFKDQAALEAAYTELETKLGAKKEEKPAGTPPNLADPKAAAAQAGFNLDDLSKEYADNNGKLTDATIAALAAKGITSAMVEGYVNGVKAQAEADRAELISVVGGGPEDLQTLYDWASKNLSREELLGYNALVTGSTRNIPAAKLLLDSMVNRFNAEFGKDPAAFNAPGARSDTGGAQPFGDRSEIVAAMSDPKYKTSEAYRKQVEARLAVTAF